MVDVCKVTQNRMSFYESFAYILNEQINRMTESEKKSSGLSLMQLNHSESTLEPYQ